MHDTPPSLIPQSWRRCAPIQPNTPGVAHTGASPTRPSRIAPRFMNEESCRAHHPQAQEQDGQPVQAPKGDPSGIGGRHGIEIGTDGHPETVPAFVALGQFLP